jgi:hypothetical protein
VLRPNENAHQLRAIVPAPAPTYVQRVWTIERSKTLPNWLCAAWRLERRHPEKYARSVLKVRVQQHRQGNSPGPVIVLPPLQNDDEPEQE